MKHWVVFLAGVMALVTLAMSQQGGSQSPLPGMVMIPAGYFEMGDHHGFVDPQHPSDEVPLHTVRLDSFQIGVNDVTTREYAEFLNSALAQGTIEVRNGGVYPTGENDLLCDTRQSSPSSRVGWDGKKFSVLDRKEEHPMVCVRWHGAVVYCNWLSAKSGRPLCYNTRNWECDFNKSGFRLPTEAEWEYAARGGKQKPYYNYPWGDDADAARANVPESRNPFRFGPQPFTTPVGFFNGKLQRKADFGWPGADETYQTENGANGFGLYDMAGNVWQWCSEWYERNYYAYSPVENPPGPAEGSPMPDGKAYRSMRGGSWFNGEFGHSRVSNRDPSYFRGPDPIAHRSDPDGPWFHIGFRVILPINAETRPIIRPTPVPHIESSQRPEGGPRAGGRVARLLPRNAEEQLNLTDQQRQQVADLEKEVAAKLAKILTPVQQKILEQAQPPRPQGGAPAPVDARNDPPQRPDDQGAGTQGGQRSRAGGGGGRITEHNKTPDSPNPGQTVGLFLNTPQAFEGYILLAPKHNTDTYLMDNQGRIVHHWKSKYEPGQSVYLKPNGNLLRTCMTRNNSFTGGGEGGRLEEYNWDGKLIWEFSYSTNQYSQHHDVVPLPNGNVLMLVVEKKTRAEAIAAGFPPDSLREDEIYPDSVVEVQPMYPNSGRVVWTWHVWDHLIQDIDRTKANYGDVAAHPELIYVSRGRGVAAFWNHANSVAYNARLDQIVVSARGNSEIWFIDHSTTIEQALGHTGGRHGKGGDLIYRWGNPSAYKRGAERDAQLDNQHDAEWIPDGYPGAGHLTIFNNGYNRGYTSIEEIVPPVDSNGRYIIEPGKPYGPEKPVWHYEAKNRTDFFSSEISGAQRLPNGNTLICAGVIGHLFEVTPAGEMVWQYVNPEVRGGILAQGELPGTDLRGHLFNAVFKAHLYAPDYAGLKGRDLTPGKVIELPASQKGKTGLDQANETANQRPRGGERRNQP